MFFILITKTPRKRLSYFDHIFVIAIVSKITQAYIYIMEVDFNFKPDDFNKILIKASVVMTEGLCKFKASCHSFCCNCQQFLNKYILIRTTV